MNINIYQFSRTISYTLIGIIALNIGQAKAMLENEEEAKSHVRSAYGKIATDQKPCFSCCSTGCGPTEDKSSAKEYSKGLGYSEQDLDESPIGADLGLGCGNPGAIASLREGEVVVDLGSGGGFDCFLASKKVGALGKVIGVDMTPEMIKLARTNASKGGFTNVEFLLGEIERLPLPDSSADVIISNCVVNLSPDKEAVFREAARVLKPGGRVAISDIVTTTEIPEEIKSNTELYTGCITGATKIDKLKSIMEGAGFGDIHIDVKEDSRSFISKWAPGSNAEDFIASAYIYATRLN
jgi:arsenite methyltransferase